MKYVTVLCLFAVSCFAADYPAPKEGDYTTRNFKFRSGESLPELRLHYTILGTPRRDARGQITNAVLILHGTGGSGKQFLQPYFAGELFGPGQPLDAARYYIILPDNVGHGGSSKPSDGLRMRFPKYDYDDMVAAQHLLLTEGLGVQHLRLIFGTSMGCMHSFVWGETYPDFMNALMPMACQTVQIAGRNRMWRKAVIDSIKLDPAWNNGDYTQEPVNGVRSAVYILAIAGSAPLLWQRLYPTRDDANKFVEETVEPRVKMLDANDMLYQFDSSRNYNPSPSLEKIRAPLMWINSTDDFINPPELDTPEREVKRIPRAQFHLIQATDQTRGHGTHTWAVFWKQYLAQLLSEEATAANSTPSVASGSSQAEAERYIHESERQWAESVASGDSSVVERILATDFIGVDPEGKQYDNATMVHDTRNAPKYFVSNRLNQVKIRFYGDMAIAQGDESWERRTGQPRFGKFVWTDTWLRRDRKWQIVAAEDLTVAEPEPKK